MTSASEFQTRRDRMVAMQIAGRGIKDPLVLAAMRLVPREQFVDETMQDYAYEDRPLPIEGGQTISQPFIVAEMIVLAGVKPGDHVLEIGAGSGYAAAVVSRIAARVIAIERVEQLARLARDRLGALGFGNVEVRLGDGTAGSPSEAPFDAILVAASAAEVPDSLKRQLKPDGRLVMPVGDDRTQHLVRVTRTGADEWREEDLGAVMFVPLISVAGQDQPSM